jgi:hypothetical protein
MNVLMAVADIGTRLQQTIEITALILAVAYVVPGLRAAENDARHSSPRRGFNMDLRLGPRTPTDIVYVVDAEASEALVDGAAIAEGQATHVRFGPFDEYVEVTYNKLRRGPDGTVIGTYDEAKRAWEIDGLVFSDLVVTGQPRDSLDEDELRFPRLSY